MWPENESERGKRERENDLRGRGDKRPQPKLTITGAKLSPMELTFHEINLKHKAHTHSPADDTLFSLSKLHRITNII